MRRWQPSRALPWAVLYALCAVGCYRAEVTLAEAQANNGSSGASAGGSGGMGGGSAENAGAECDPTGGQLDPVQSACRGELPTKAECGQQDPTGWSGCYDGGCTVCTADLLKYPYYFSRHPCCVANDSCLPDMRAKCNVRCPPPTVHDQLPPCTADAGGNGP